LQERQGILVVRQGILVVLEEIPEVLSENPVAVTEILVGHQGVLMASVGLVVPVCQARLEEEFLLGLQEFRQVTGLAFRPKAVYHGKIYTLGRSYKFLFATSCGMEVLELHYLDHAKVYCQRMVKIYI